MAARQNAKSNRGSQKKTPDEKRSSFFSRSSQNAPKKQESDPETPSVPSNNNGEKLKRRVPSFLLRGRSTNNSTRNSKNVPPEAAPNCTPPIIPEASPPKPTPQPEPIAPIPKPISQKKEPSSPTTCAAKPSPLGNPAAANVIPQTMWDNTCKKLANLTKHIQSLTISLDKKEAEMVAFGCDRKLEESRLNEALANAKKEAHEWQQICSKTQGETESIKRSLADLQDQWKTREMKLLDEHQDKMSKMTLSMARQQDTFEKKFSLLEKTQKEVEESHSRASTALKKHHAKELQDLAHKHDLIMKTQLRQLEECFRHRTEILEKNIANVQAIVGDRVAKQEQVVQTITNVLQEVKNTGTSCNQVEKSNQTIEAGLKNLQLHMDQVKESAILQVQKLEQQLREEAEMEQEAKRREYCMSLSVVKSAARDVLDILAKEFRPLAYSCQCPQRMPMRGAQLCLTCLVKRICDKARKEDEARKRKDKESAAKDIEWLEKERLWKEKEDSLNTKLKETTDQLKLKEQESQQLKQDAKGLKAEVEKNRQTMSELQESLKNANKLCDMEKDFDAAQKTLAHKEGEVKTLEKSRQDWASKCQKLEAVLAEAEKREKEILQKNAHLESECQKLAQKLDQIGAEKEALWCAKQGDVSEREDEFKFIQQALEEALQERELIQDRFEKEFETIRTMSSDKEQQMMEDFEWKLREIEKEYKRRMDEKDKEAQEKLKHIRESVEEELSIERKEVQEQRRLAEEQLNRVVHLKSYEPELRQLQGLVHEQQKALRFCYHACDKLKTSETNLLEEQKKTKQQLEQLRLKKAVPEEKLQEALYKMKNQLNAEWEDKLRSECARLKCEMDQLHLEEKRLAMEAIKAQNDRQLQHLQETFDKDRQSLQSQIKEFTSKLMEKERCITERKEANSALKLLSASVEADDPDADIFKEFEDVPEENLVSNKQDLRINLEKSKGGKFDVVAISELAKAAVEEAAIREAAAKAKTASILRAHEECLALIKKALEDHNIPWDSLNIGSPFEPHQQQPSSNPGGGGVLLSPSPGHTLESNMAAAMSDRCSNSRQMSPSPGRFTDDPSR